MFIVLTLMKDWPTYKVINFSLQENPNSTSSMISLKSFVYELGDVFVLKNIYIKNYSRKSNACVSNIYIH